MNPAREVKTERFSRTEGKTPAFVEGEVQKLLGVIETTTHTGLRDRALLGVLAYTFARIGAVVNLKVEDYYPSGKRFLLRFKEKGGKEKELPVHHKLEELLDQYLKATGLEKEPGSPLFPASIGKTGKLSRRPLVRTDAADLLKRRLKQAGLPAHYSPHSFRATGITNFLENDGTLEAAQRIAGHNTGFRLGLVLGQCFGNLWRTHRETMVDRLDRRITRDEHALWSELWTLHIGKDSPSPKRHRHSTLDP
jgi:integrase/recombinase XerD